MTNGHRAVCARILAWFVEALLLAVPVGATALTLDVTTQFSITRSGLVLNRASNTFDATVKLTNASTAPVLGPLTVAVGGLPSGVTLANAAGSTADGRPFVAPLAAGAQVAPGAANSFVLKFANPGRVTFNYFLQVLYTVADEQGAPSLLGVAATGAASAVLLGRIDGAPSQSVTLEVLGSATCVNGTLLGAGVVNASLQATTDADGYFQVAVQGVAPGSFLAVRLRAPRISVPSLCQASSRDNDAWPKAFPLEGTSASASDYIDAPGRARWYRVAISPGQRLQVTLSQLPADFDVAVFRDIAQAFTREFDPVNATTHDLVRLAAETAPSMFSPTSMSPSMFSPSMFSPDAYSPSMFSPASFSASVFAPSMFSPSMFSPSMFSPSMFSPSMFSPSMFSPERFGPSTFAPSMFSPDAIAKAFSTAQTRSIVAFAPVPGAGNESLVANTWNNTGEFYIRVTGRDGAFSTTGRFALTVTKGPTSCAAVTQGAPVARPLRGATGRRTVILLDSTRVALDEPLTIAGTGTLRERLAAFAARPEVAAAIVDVDGDAHVRQLKEQAAANPACPYAKNLVAEEIKRIVDSYRANPLRYVVLLGNDESVPFFRTPDLAELGLESGYVPPVQSNSSSEASLRRDYVLGQDAYGTSTKLALPWGEFTMPGLAVGRLVETAAEIAGQLDAYMATNGVVVPRTSLVTGYDFLEDAAGAVRVELEAGTGAAGDALVTPRGRSPQDPASWNASQLAARLLGARHDIVFLAGHFSANSALAADFTTSLLTSDLAASAVDLANAIVFSAGCHSGYNVVDAHAIPGATMPLDWAQAFARKRAVLVAGTGYQYGDTDFLEYSERLYRNFARALRAGTGPVAIGEALVRAKLDYLATTAPDIRGLHEKALLQATLFGLPMLAVDMPAGRGAVPGNVGVIAPVPVAGGPAATLGLRIHDATVVPQLAPQSVTLQNVATGQNVTASWLNGSDGVVTQPGEPALPLVAVNATPTNAALVLRGVGFRGGTFVDSGPMVPFTGAPTTELRGVHGQFVSPVFYPARMWGPNYFGALSGGGGTQLLVTPVQHRVANIAQGTSTQRRYTNLSLRLYYSGELGRAALSDAPTIVAQEASRAGGNVAFTAQVVGDPSAAIHQVWITYASDSGNAWTSLDLAQCVAPLPAVCAGVADSRLWKGQLANAPASFRYMVQAASGVGLVTVDDNGGAYYGVGTPTPAATTLAFITPPSSGTTGSAVDVRVKLAVGGQGIGGKTVAVAAGEAIRFGTTGADGTATLRITLAATPGNYPLTATFIGDDALLPASATTSFQLNRAPASLVALAPAGATLTGTLGGRTQVLQQEPVRFGVTGPAGALDIWDITDHLGRVTLPPPGLPAGDYTVVSASFAGNATFAPSTLAYATPQRFTVARIAQTLAFPALANTTPSSPPVAVVATASSGLPVAFTVSGACAVAGNVVTPNGVGTCTVTATQAGDAVYAPVAASRSFAIGRATQSITFAPAPSGVTVGQPLVFVSASSGSAQGAPSTLPIAFTSLTPLVCTVGAGVNSAPLTLLAAGTCTIAANQPGDAGYDNATQATQSFAVGPTGGAPATFTVTNLNDSGAGSLRGAIGQANAAPGANIVDFAAGLTGTITLTSGPIAISGPTMILGPGADVLTVSGNLASRIFNIGVTFPAACPDLDGPDYVVMIADLTLADARRLVAGSSSGAIYTEHSLVLSGVVIRNSAARSGGAVGFIIQYPGQLLRIENSRFLDNFAGELVPPNNAFATNGGALFVTEQCTTALDTPHTQPVTISIAGSEFRGNSARPLTERDGHGGAIRSWSLADIHIADTIIVDNHVDAPNPPVPEQFYIGGGIEGLAKSWRLERVEIAENSANDVTGADVTRGGGVRIQNYAADRQGAAERVGVRIVNSTISGNAVSATGGAMTINGNVAVELINSTVSDNVAAEARTGGIVLSVGDTYPVTGWYTARPSLTLVSSIVANNNGNGGDIAAGATGNLPTFTVNAVDSLIERLCPPPNCQISVAGSGFLVGVDPLLGPLQDNGGESRTHALLPGSQAINAGSNPLGLASDQRGPGFPRVVGPRADMGAFERP